MPVTRPKIVTQSVEREGRFLGVHGCPWTLTVARVGPRESSPAYSLTPARQTFTLKDVEEHTSEASAWIIVEGQVYDMTGKLTGMPRSTSYWPRRITVALTRCLPAEFLGEHPGGKKILLK